MKLLHMSSLIIISYNMYLCEGIKYAINKKLTKTQILSLSPSAFLKHIENNNNLLSTRDSVIVDFDYFNDELWSCISYFMKMNFFSRGGKAAALTNKKAMSFFRNNFLSTLSLSQVFESTLSVGDFSTNCLEWLNEIDCIPPKVQKIRKDDILIIYETLSGKKLQQQALDRRISVKTIYSRRKKTLDRLGYKNINDLIRTINNNV
ncbi:hypothetical protein NP681_004482 [Salmonella enterica]|nr:hypothetical protein [Salmonella enterica]EJR3519425.1 hypothetical protein [Salmonella enterica]